MTPSTDLRLLKAAIDLTSNLDVQQALTAFLQQSCQLTGAHHGTVALIDTWGETVDEMRLGNPAVEVPRDLIRVLSTTGRVLINDFASDKLPEGLSRDSLPTALPSNFLGVPIRIQERVYALLYLTDAVGGFDDSAVRVVEALAAAAGIAVENAHLYEDSKRRERWISASQQLTTTMLEGTDEEEALQLIANTVRDVAGADTAIIVLPSVGSTWAAEITVGAHSEQLLGVVFPPEGRAMQVRAEGTGMIVDSLARATSLRVPQLAVFGPALYAPLRSRGESLGILILLREQGAQEFDASELTLAESLATQATLALELASARHAEDVAALLDERDRIGRDLHDFAIQQLFATGMRLDTAKQKVASGDLDIASISDALDHSLAGIDEAVRQIRAIVHDLKEPDRTVGLVERVRRESSLSRSFLGFAPSLLIRLGGLGINESQDSEEDQIYALESRVSETIADDVVAIVREGLSNIARHARATAGEVHLDVDSPEAPGKLRVVVADDGRGIDPNRTRNSGLSNMRDRARIHDGMFEIRPGIGGKGTRILWTVPLG